MPEQIRKPVIISNAPAFEAVATDLSPVLMKGLATAIVNFIREREAERDRQLADEIEAAIARALTEIKSRLLELEQRPVLAMRGAWRDAGRYQLGDCVQHQGGLWRCVAASSSGARPGKSDEWKLTVKSGSFTE